MRYPFIIKAQLVASLTITLLVAAGVEAQSIRSDADVDPNTWKIEKLDAIAEELNSKALTGKQRYERQSQQRWLGRWTPGEMKIKPAAVEGLPKARKEPIFDSPLASQFRKQLNWDQIDQDVNQQKRLEQAISQHPDDLGLRQLQLHWLDLPLRRKLHLKQVVDSADRLIEMLQSDDESLPKHRLALEFVRYRKGRALAYRELPDVVEHTPIENPEKLNQQIATAFDDLIQNSGRGKPEFILLEIRMLRRDQQYGSALEGVERYGSTIQPKWYLKKRRDLLKLLEWRVPYEEAARLYAEQFPEEVAKETLLKR